MSDSNPETPADGGPEVGCMGLLGGVSVAAVERDTANYIKGVRVTLKRGDGKTFKVNLHDDGWGDGYIYGLNLVFDHSGEGDHYT